MSRYHSHINTAIKLLQSYKGELPFSIFIKHFFSKEKKYGSKDRKQIATLCYSYFRVGLAMNKDVSATTLLKALFLTSNAPNAILEQLKPEWHQAITSSVDEKIQLLEASFNINNIFPFKDELNSVTATDAFVQSFLLQPNLFVRIRPQYKKQTIEKVKQSGIAHQLLNNDHCIQFPSATKIEGFLEPDKEVVIQDYNSQQVLNYLIEQNTIPLLQQKEIAVWDCCAASGGKSILITDLLQQKINLTVSDIRQSTLTNLQERFKKAGIKNYHSFVADISNADKKLPGNNQYDLIICDAPCTGSGTWSRTPEQLYFFNTAAIDEYAAIQKKIAVNASCHLKKDGLFFYITCSVFTKENEAVANHILQQTGMQLLEMKNLPGFGMQADSMFVAVFKKLSDQ
jgi:16S rRNA (cytosine967-C5)-methyltransferase